VLASSFLAECKASCLDVKTVEGEVIVIVGSQKDYLYLYKEGICIQKTEHFQDVKIVAVKISPNGKQLASADNKHNISLWELASMNVS
jgi:WD40 repeat protein